MKDAQEAIFDTRSKSRIEKYTSSRETAIRLLSGNRPSQLRNDTDTDTDLDHHAEKRFKPTAGHHSFREKSRSPVKQPLPADLSRLRTSSNYIANQQDNRGSSSNLSELSGFETDRSRVLSFGRGAALRRLNSGRI